MDQQARQAFDLTNPAGAATATLKRTDGQNLRFLRHLVRHDDDVPTATSVGADGMDAFWLLVQHADLDWTLQGRVLDVLRARHEPLPLDQMAFLEDRVRVNQKRPQRYGTQFQIQGSHSAPAPREALQIQPIEDAAHLDEHRAEMNLMPLKDYECVLRAVYGIRP